MTFQPPPPPPPPGGPPPPPPGYGPPPGGNPYGGPGPGFDPKSVSPLDWGIIAAGVIGFIFNFVHYYSFKGVYSQGGGLVGFLAAVLGLVGAGAVAMTVFAPHAKLPVPARLVGLGAFGLATLLTLLKLFVRPSFGGCAYSSYCHKITLSIGFGLIICLIAFIAGTVLSLMRFQKTGGQLPGGLSKMPNIGGRGPGAPPPPGGPGYGPPPGGGGGYGPPAQ